MIYALQLDDNPCFDQHVKPMTVPDKNDYVLRGGDHGAERLRLLPSVKWPTTKPLLDRAGLCRGMCCLNMGCGIGHVTLRMAEAVQPTGRVTGIDFDKRCLGSYREKQPPDIQGSGWVVKSLEASLWAFHDAESFDEAVLKAVNLGDDADTTGAICGQLAGAYWGESGISESLRSGLARMDMIEKVLEKLL